MLPLHAGDLGLALEGGDPADGAAGADVYPVEPAAARPELALSAARCWRIESADVMKTLHSEAGNVPPATGLPPYSVFIGRSLSG